MPNARRIKTETPDVEQWRLLSQYRYPSNISRFLTGRGLQRSANGIEDYVAGSVGQAEAYFAATQKAPLEIAPLLGYYGATSLLAGIGGLLTGAPLPMAGHGMRLCSESVAHRVSDVALTVSSTESGALHQFATMIEEASEVPGGSTWTLGELLTLLPDLRDDVRLFLPALTPHVLRVDAIRTLGVAMERIDVSEFAGQAPSTILSMIPDLRGAYLAPQEVNGGVILFPRYGSTPITVEAHDGRKSLLVGYVKNGRTCAPSQLLTMVMALFILSGLSRYHPRIWHPFVRADVTGERLLVERFLSLATRWLPNLALNILLAETIHFVATNIRQDGRIDGMSEAELRELVQEIVNDIPRTTT